MLMISDRCWAPCLACWIVDCFTECKSVKCLGGDCVGIAGKAVLLLYGERLDNMRR